MSQLQLIITCENCGHVEHFKVKSEMESEKIIDNFTCPGQCSPKLYSYITIGQISMQSFQQPAYVAQVA